MTALVLAPAAVADLGEIHVHYDTVEGGLIWRFVGALDELFARLETFPRSAPLVAGYVDARRAVVRGFPYVVFYRHRHRPDRIDVLRVLHTAREDADRPTRTSPRVRAVGCRPAVDVDRDRQRRRIGGRADACCTIRTGYGPLRAS